MVNYRYFLDITHNKAATTINYCVRKPGVGLKIDSWKRSILTIFQFFPAKIFLTNANCYEFSTDKFIVHTIRRKTQYDVQPTYHIKQAVRFIMRWSGLHCIQVNTDGFLVLVKSMSEVHVFGSLIIAWFSNRTGTSVDDDACVFSPFRALSLRQLTFPSCC